jgi:RNA polymerase sigma factor (sigma-70 family)
MKSNLSAWLNAAGRYPVLPEAETLRLARKIQEAETGSPARIKLVNKLCVHNLRLVAKFARSYMNSSNRQIGMGDDAAQDYLQQGYFGLRRAAEKFDPERGYTFATYASAWVRQALGRYHVENLSVVRVPESSAREIFYYNNHGKPRNEKVAKWVAQAAESAKMAYAATSYDAQVLNDTSFLEILSDENRLIDPTEQEPISRVVDTVGIMSSLGIEPRVQDLVLAYIKRGNMDTVLMKHKCNSKETRAKVRDAIAKIQEHCGAAVG